MKKIFCFVAAALVSLSALAVDGVNVMTSGLKATFNDDVTEMTIDYVLNTAATAIEVEFFDADNELVSIVELTDPTLFTEGAHMTTIEIPLDDLEPGVISWGLHAYGATTVFENKLSINDLKYKFYLPQDVVVDNSFESPFFGRVYVGQATDGESDGLTSTTKTQTRGIFIYDTQMNLVDGQDVPTNGYDGGLGGTRSSRQGFKRLSIDENGFVYVSSRDAATKGVYRMDPANPSANFATVLSASVTVDAVETAKGKLYTLEGMSTTSGNFNTYDLSAIPVAEPTATSPTAPLMLANSDATLRSDRKKGFWATQYRSSPDEWSALVHFSKNGVPNYFINGSQNTELLSKTESEYAYRGVMGVNRDGSIIAVGSDGRAKVFSVEWGEDGAPTLTSLCETPFLGDNLDGIAFDAADNMYVLSARVEQMFLFPIAKENSNCRVLAASSYSFVVEGEDPELPTAPETAPAAPTHDEADVMAIYCNHYATNNANFGISGWAGAYQTLDIDGTKIGAWTAMTWECIIDPVNTDAAHDFSAYENIHVDMWAPAAAKIKLTAEAIAGGNYKDGQVLELAEGWNSFDIPVADWTGNYDFKNMKCFVLEQYQTPEGASFEGNAFAFANLYFWGKATAVENVTVDTKTVKLIRDGQVLILRNGVEYNVLGTELK